MEAVCLQELQEDQSFQDAAWFGAEEEEDV
jgi:hypothetical protein